ncbi:MAG: hypothetical protein KC910_34400 [Candidatus Eremiobacteraeota bacterium]|nr:hypothetical protein [Candidatus Eremiobacteraeota bacterium]
MRGRRRGLTLAETLVGAFIFGLLLTALFGVFRLGATAWQQGTTRTNLLQACQVVSGRLDRDAERSTVASVSLGPGGNGVAFLSPIDANGVFQYDETTVEPRWQHYVVYYYDGAGQAIYRREVSVVGTPQETTPAPIETFSGGPITNFFNNGRKLASEITACTFLLTPDNQLGMTCTATRARYGSTTPEQATITTMIRLRN